MAMEYLVGLTEATSAVEADSREIENRTVATTRWLTSQARTESDGAINWDGTQWDTAVTLRAIIVAHEKYPGSFADAERTFLDALEEGATKWLVGCVVSWHMETESRGRYLAGPADLAQVLIALMVLNERSPRRVERVQAAFGFTADASAIDEAVRVLLAQANSERISADSDRGDSEEFHYWVDAFNSGEVIDALTRYYLVYHESNSAASRGYSVRARDLSLECLRFMECTQSEGTWGGIADTCGTLYYYLLVGSRLKSFNYQDHIVFKALRWMCDGNQSMADGSFLHSSYTTVFYALALLEAFRNWELGRRSSAEVYDVALWLAPNLVSHERSRRLELELRLEDSLAKERRLQDAALRGRLRFRSVVASALGAVSTVLLTVIFGAANLSASSEIVDSGVFWGILGIGAVVVPLGVSAYRKDLGSRLHS